MVAEFANQDMGEQPGTRNAAINGTTGCGRLHDAVTAGAGLFRSTMTNHSPMPGHVLDLLGDIFAKIVECSTALRTARIFRLMDKIFARQMIGERSSSSRLAHIMAALLAHFIHVRTPSETTQKALDYIGELYGIEASIRGKPPTERLLVRQERAKPLLESYGAWLRAELKTLSAKSETTKAINYSLNQWDALMLYCDDGAVEIDNNLAENALRCVALGRKNFLFCGSDSGGERAAAMYSLIQTCRLNEIDPRAYLAHVLTCIADHPINRIEELLPWRVHAPLHGYSGPI